ncbi:MAG: flagellar basal body-associated protein FliL [Pseudomonadota bacterium]|jgi:flagellar FliL protein
MAEEEKNEAPEAVAPAAPNRKKRVLVAVGGTVALLIAVGFPAGYFLLKEEPKEVSEITPDMAPENQMKPEGHDDGEEELEEGEEPLGAIVPLETFLVNLSGGKYIRTQVQVEFESLDVPRRFYTRAVPIRDGIISLLTQTTAENLETSKGKDKLRADIRSTINTALRKEEVRRVYFTQFVIQ